MYRPLALMRDAALSQNKAALRPNQGGDRHKPSHEMPLLFLEFSGSFFGKTFLLASGRTARRVDDLVEIVRQPILVVSLPSSAETRGLRSEQRHVLATRRIPPPAHEIALP
jgi:hypothetical protein